MNNISRRVWGAHTSLLAEDVMRLTLQQGLGNSLQVNLAGKLWGVIRPNIWGNLNNLVEESIGYG